MHYVHIFYGLCSIGCNNEAENSNSLNNLYKGITILLIKSDKISDGSGKRQEIV